MKAKRGLRTRRTLFLLHEIVPMRPYLFHLMTDLRNVVLEKRRIERRLRLFRNDAERAYEERRERHLLMEELDRQVAKENEIKAEFAGLGIRVGNVVRGEMNFPCLIDHHDAYFIWYDSDNRPTHWRFRGSRAVFEIPRQWFSPTAVQTERKPKRKGMRSP